MTDTGPSPIAVTAAMEHHVAHGPDGATRGGAPGLRGPEWVGTRVDAGATIPVAGTWELVDHPDHPRHLECPGHGRLRSFGRGDLAPPCPYCGLEACWQLDHLAVTVAADHHDRYGQVDR
jgi:hypothetical protein